MGMSFDGQAVVEGGRVVLEGLPYEDGRAVRFEVTPVDEQEADRRPPSELTSEEWIARMQRVAKEIHALHPNSPILTDYEVSRDSIYEDERGL